MAMNFNSRVVALKMFWESEYSCTGELVFALLLAILGFVAFLNRIIALVALACLLLFPSSPSIFCMF